MSENMANTVKYTLLATGIVFALLAANIAQAMKLPVLKKTVKSGTIITSDMIDYKTYDERRLPRHAITHPDQLIGKEATRTVRENRPVQNRFVRIPPFGRKGQVVTLEYRKAGMRLASEGRLLSDASQGEIVRVQNLDTRRTLVGTIIANGLVVIQ